MSDGMYSTYEVRTRAVMAVVKEGLAISVVAKAFGTNRTTIHRWLSRYHLNGDAGLVRRQVSGRPAKLVQLNGDSLRDLVMAPASDFGYETDFWTTRRLIQTIESQFDVRLSKRTVLRRLHAAGLTYQKPERQYFELSDEKRAEWVQTMVPKIRAAVQKHKAILYFQDERPP